MRLPVRFSAAYAALAAFCFWVGARAQAQTPPAQTPPAQSSNDQGPANAPYVTINPLAGVRYDNRYDISLGLAYDHMKAGPTLLQGSNLGGLDVSGSYWLTKRWGAEGSFRPYVGTSGAGPNDASIKGPFVSQYFFDGGPEWLGPHNAHGDLIAHVLVGGVYGNFEQDLRGNSPSVVDFYNNQVAFSTIMGGHFDLNRSGRWVFRVTPDAMLTRYSINYGNRESQIDINFAISVGLEYKFKKRR